jgi:MoaA/NifB/PqqE/SkfB family radical SAM enzyme
MNNSERNISSKQHLNTDLGEFYFQWHITEKCNLRCSHCYQETYNVQPECSLAQLKGIADLIDLTLNKWQRRGRIALTGGEPFLRKELFPLMEYLERKENAWKVGVLTNGTLIDEKIADKLKAFQKLYYIQIETEK